MALSSPASKRCSPKRRSRLHCRPAAQVQLPPRGTPGPARRAPEAPRRRREAGFPAGNRAKSARSDWTVAPLPEDILDRRVEITGPVDRKMIINALNCGANVFMADFEDASTPSWANMIEGQYNLADAVRRQIDYLDPNNGKSTS